MSKDEDKRIDMIWDSIQQIQEDVKQIIYTLPKLQEKKRCEQIRREDDKEKKGFWKWILAWGLGAPGMILAGIQIIEAITKTGGTP